MKFGESSVHDDTTMRIATWAHGLRWDDIADSTVKALTWHHLDSVGCAIGAIDADPCAAARELAVESETTRGVSVLGTPIKVAPEWGAFANTAMIRYLDYNDNYFRMGGGHTSDIIAALWSAAESTRASGATLIEGMHVGYETHMALADVVDLRDRGWDYPAFIGISAAAGAARVLGLTVDQTAHAIAMVVAGASAPLGVTRVGQLGNWKALCSSHATMSGFMAARLAGRGVTGPSRAIEGHRGLWDLVTGEFSLDNLGKPLNGYTAAERSAYKLHVADFTTQIIVQEFIGLHDEGVTPDDIESVRIAVPWVAWSECGGGEGDREEKWDPQSKETADHSIPYVASVALVDGFVQPESYRPERFLDPALRPMMAKIEVVPDEEITKTWMQKPTNVITLKLRPGEAREIHVDYPRGHHLNPVSDDELLTKFRHQCSSVVPQSREGALLEVLPKLSVQESLDGLFTNLRQVREEAH